MEDDVLNVGGVLAGGTLSNFFTQDESRLRSESHAVRLEARFEETTGRFLLHGAVYEHLIILRFGLGITVSQALSRMINHDEVTHV